MFRKLFADYPGLGRLCDVRSKPTPLVLCRDLTFVFLLSVQFEQLVVIVLPHLPRRGFLSDQQVW